MARYRITIEFDVGTPLLGSALKACATEAAHGLVTRGKGRPTIVYLATEKLERTQVVPDPIVDHRQ